ncbi:MAG: VOC family protein [Terracidiphilus sp.]
MSLRSPLIYNRSVPPCAVIPVLCYPDPSAAAEWLEKAFGFSVRLRIANHRIQMRAGQGCLTLREGNIVPNQACMVQIRVEDARAHCERARKAGAKILTEPKDHMYGERQYNAEDFYGHRWDFTETIADIEPESWGGASVNIEPPPSQHA